MTSLHKIGIGEMTEFFRILSSAGMHAEDVRKIIRNSEVVDVMLEAMWEHRVFQLIHGRFNPLKAKIEMVREWPGITGEQIDAAIKEAEYRITHFENLSPKNPLLDLVITVYQENAASTLEYVKDRLEEVWENKYEWPEDCAHGIHDNFVRYRRDNDGNYISPVYHDVIRIELVDLGTVLNDPHYNFKALRSKDFASFAPFYAAIQDPEWINQMDGCINGGSIPYVVITGIELNPLEFEDAWNAFPYICSGGGPIYLEKDHGCTLYATGIGSAPELVKV